MSLINIGILAFFASSVLSAIDNHQDNYPDEHLFNQVRKAVGSFQTDGSVHASITHGALIAGVLTGGEIHEPARSHLENNGLFNQGQKRVDPEMQELYLRLFLKRLI